MGKKFRPFIGDEAFIGMRVYACEEGELVGAIKEIRPYKIPLGACRSHLVIMTNGRYWSLGNSIMLDKLLRHYDCWTDSRPYGGENEWI